MKKCFYWKLAVLFFLWASSANGQTLVWSDEFNSPTLDADKWTHDVGGHGFGNGELQYYTSGERNVFIGSRTNASDTGYLVIEARRENYGIAPQNRQFTSGRIKTSGKFNFKYGTIEARIKLPDLQNGLWPAFWLLGANYPTDGWPRSGEIDILEAGFRDDWQNNVANKKANFTIHWHQDDYLTLVPNAHSLGWYGNASYSNDTTIAGRFDDGFHLFKLEWTPTVIRGYVDNIHYYTFEIPQNNPNITEFNTNPYYVILNLAVGGSNFVGISDPAQITAPLPAQMLIDYVRVYSNQHTETFQAKALPRQTGTFGVFTETTPTTASLGAAPTIEVWNNLTAAPTSAQEGSNVLSFTASPGNWFGMGIPTGATNIKNMQNFIDGTLHFHMKTTSQWPISVGIISTANGNAQDGTRNGTVRLDPAAPNQYGLVRDGQWHEVVIPLSMFTNVEFRSINNMFYIVGDNPSSPVTFAVDNIYWKDGTKVTPQQGDFVIYSDTRTGVEKFNLGTDGNFFVWESTLVPQATPPAEGPQVLSFTHNNRGWFGAAFTPSKVYNLTAFKNANAKLVFSLKTSDTSTPFHIGMKSGLMADVGQKWISFLPGQTPYGFVRNGTWQVVEIPMSHFYDEVDLMEVTQLLQLLGNGNISNLAIDNIYITGGGTATPDNGVNTPPTANSGPDRTVNLPTNTVTLNGTGTDAEGAIASYAWTRISGPNTPTLTGANTANVTLTGLIQGTYVYRLTVSDAQGATGSDDVTITVLPNQNLAFQKPVTVSSTENAGTPGSSAVDGNLNTRWSSQFSDPQHIIVDLGATYSINRVKITWEAAYGRNYNIQVRNSTTAAWTTIRAVTNNTTLVNDQTGLSGSGRYVRIEGLARGTAYGYSIFELEVYGSSNAAPTANAGVDRTITLPTNSIVINGSGADTDGTIASYSWAQVSGPNTATLANANTANVTASGLVAGTYVFRLTVTDNGGLSASDDVSVVVNAAPNVNLALNKPVTVSSVESAAMPGSAAVDGSVNTRWSSQFSDAQDIVVDLGASYAISRVRVTWEAAYGSDYNVQVRNSTTASWTTIRAVTGNTTLVNDHTGLSGTGRYVRIQGVRRATPYGYSIFELEVYGTATTSAAMSSTASVYDVPDDTSISLYPNPSSGIVKVDGVDNGTFVEFVNATGKSYLFKVEDHALNIIDLPTGIYVAHFRKEGKIVRKRIVKE